MSVSERIWTQMHVHGHEWTINVNTNKCKIQVSNDDEDLSGKISKVTPTIGCVTRRRNSSSERARASFGNWPSVARHFKNVNKFKSDSF